MPTPSAADAACLHRLAKRLIYVTGLPRASSTLLCQLLGHHPEVHSDGHSSPLCQALMGLRHSLSENDFLLSRLDVEFEASYRRLLGAFRGFVNGWCAEAPEPWVVEKNRGWLQHIETVGHLDPDFRMLVCVRELGQICGSVEAQHQTPLRRTSRLGRSAARPPTLEAVFDPPSQISC